MTQRMCCMLRAKDARIAELEAQLAACQAGGGGEGNVIVDESNVPFEDSEGGSAEADV